MQYTEKIELYVDGVLMGAGRLTDGGIHRYVAQVEDAQLVTDYVMDLIERSIALREIQLRFGHAGAIKTITWKISKIS